MKRGIDKNEKRQGELDNFFHIRLTVEFLSCRIFDKNKREGGKQKEEKETIEKENMIYDTLETRKKTQSQSFRQSIRRKGVMKAVS